MPKFGADYHYMFCKRCDFKGRTNVQFCPNCDVCLYYSCNLCAEYVKAGNKTHENSMTHRNNVDTHNRYLAELEAVISVKDGLEAKLNAATEELAMVRAEFVDARAKFEVTESRLESEKNALQVKHWAADAYVHEFKRPRKCEYCHKSVPEQERIIEITKAAIIATSCRKCAKLVSRAHYDQLKSLQSQFNKLPKL